NKSMPTSTHETRERFYGAEGKVGVVYFPVYHPSYLSDTYIEAMEREVIGKIGEKNESLLNGNAHATLYNNVVEKKIRNERVVEDAFRSSVVCYELSAGETVNFNRDNIYADATCNVIFYNITQEYLNTPQVLELQKTRLKALFTMSKEIPMVISVFSPI